MALATIVTDGVTGGSNSHATSVYALNMHASDFGAPGVIGTITANTGSGGAGGFCVNADSVPDMGVTVKAGTAYVRATPSGQTSQLVRAYMSADTTTYTISANSSGSTKYDWIYLSVDATKANNPAADSSDVTSLYTSRSSSNTTDNGSPPTYGLLLAIVTVANGAASITNSNITDKRTNASWSTIQSNTYFFDFVESGCVWSGDSYGSTLNASMTSGYVWLSGQRLSVAAVSGRTFTASKDTYVDLSNNGDGTAAFTYTTVNNNAASPALAAGAIRIAIIVAGAGSIANSGSVNQGQETAVLPIASSIPYQVTDSLGNLICSRDPQRRILGYRQAVGDQLTSSTSQVQVTGLSVPVIIPTNRKIKVTLVAPQTYNATLQNGVSYTVWDGTVGSGTQISGGQINSTSTNVSNLAYSFVCEAIITPTSASKTYNAGFSAVTGGTAHTQGASTSPVILKVELV